MVMCSYILAVKGMVMCSKNIAVQRVSYIMAVEGMVMCSENIAVQVSAVSWLWSRW